MSTQPRVMSKRQKEKAASEQPTRYDVPTELMKAMGSPNGWFDPMPPEQYLWVMKNSRCPEERFMAWLAAHTIRREHHVEYAVDQDGRTLWIEDFALATGWTEQTARNVINTCVQQGRAKLDHKRKRIYFPAVVEPQKAEAEDKDKGEEMAKTLTLYGSFSTKLPIFINNMEPEKRAVFVKRLDWLLAVRKKVEAEAMAAGRHLLEPMVDSVLRSGGFVKDALGSRQSTLFKLELVKPLPSPPWDVEEEAEGSVQSCPASAEAPAEPLRTTGAMGLHKPKNGFVHENAPLVPLEIKSEVIKSSHPRSKSSVPDRQVSASLSFASHSSSSSRDISSVVEETGRAEADSLNEKEFGRGLVQAFFHATKPVPTKPQIAEICAQLRTLKTEAADARAALLRELSAAVPRMQHPGFLLGPKGYIQGFLDSWPAKRAIRERQRREAEAVHRSWQEREKSQRDDDIKRACAVVASPLSSRAHKQEAQELLEVYGVRTMNAGGSEES